MAKPTVRTRPAKGPPTVRDREHVSLPVGSSPSAPSPTRASLLHWIPMTLHLYDVRGSRRIPVQEPQEVRHRRCDPVGATLVLLKRMQTAAEESTGPSLGEARCSAFGPPARYSSQPEESTKFTARAPRSPDRGPERGPVRWTGLERIHGCARWGSRAPVGRRSVRRRPSACSPGRAAAALGPPSEGRPGTWEKRSRRSYAETVDQADVEPVTYRSGTLAATATGG